MNVNKYKISTPIYVENEAFLSPNEMTQTRKLKCAVKFLEII